MDYSRTGRIARGGVVLLTMLAAGTGCPPPQQEPNRLDTAESLYRQGREIEDRVAGSEAEAKANLQQARTVYIRALKADPSTRLEAYIRAGIGNVAFYQDDYQTAVEQFATAYDRLDESGLQAMTLLRMGMAQQRLGRWEQADRTFLQLQRLFPQSSAAQVSRTKYGARQFWLQLATFSQPALADKAIIQLQKEGFRPSRTADAQGRHIVRVGPANSYAEALGLKIRLAATYPGSIINP